MTFNVIQKMKDKLTANLVVNTEKIPKKESLSVLSGSSPKYCAVLLKAS